MSKIRRLIVLIIIALTALVVLDNAQTKEQTRAEEVMEFVVDSQGSTLHPQTL